jgi:hypothetical protein
MVGRLASTAASRPVRDVCELSESRLGLSVEGLSRLDATNAMTGIDRFGMEPTIDLCCGSDGHTRLRRGCRSCSIRGFLIRCRNFVGSNMVMLAVSFQTGLQRFPQTVSLFLCSPTMSSLCSHRHKNSLLHFMNSSSLIPDLRE